MGFKRDKTAAIIQELETALANERGKSLAAIRRVEEAERRVVAALAEAKAARKYLDDMREAVDGIYRTIYPSKPRG
jgi:hypothetical protein